ncbi:carbonic anhydrase [Actinomycetospora endophytica]|uniref:carbonic anhydrase n=1 Tax=Actinomycetospora endophytica TaxID=2291215 RepID=A0ABS8PI29_9PSEU|nr:carbonic anhydrase [Actinomycetospora endophytica]MCD2197926.1 carbonic anhydrase [Actinomycetospora endophytica]
MSVTDEYLQNNETYAAGFAGPLPLPPARKTAVVACMERPLNVYGVLGLQEGDSHVIRNAGGIVADDTIRSLAISQHLLGTEEIVLIHHTDCGMLTFSDEQFAGILEQASGERPNWTANSFPDLEGDVRDSIKRIIDSPFVKNKSSVRGFVFDVATGKLHEVS